MKALLLSTAFLSFGLYVQAEAKSFEEIFPSSNSFSAEEKAALKGIDFQQGMIKLPQAQATLNITPQFYYLNPADARKVLVEMWGNSASQENGGLGMIFPSNCTPMSEQCWGSLVEYSDDGYVSDADMADTDFDQVLKDLQADAKQASDQRVKEGQSPVELVGWASQPYYDKNAHNLHWAKHLAFGTGDNQNHTLNYDVRNPGREGVVSFNFIASMDQLPEIKAAIPAVTKIVQFDQGKAYSDYVEGDKVAAYGMAGMVAAGVGAKVAAKLGLLAVAIALLKKFGIFVAIAALGAFRYIKGMFGNKTA